MLSFVGEEVERLKGMFTAKEQRLSADRDAAHMAADSAQREADSLRLKAQQLQGQCTSATTELTVLTMLLAVRPIHSCVVTCTLGYMAMCWVCRPCKAAACFLFPFAQPIVVAVAVAAAG